MHKIKELTLQNFKFFYGKVLIPFERKHALIYGENGSGKSSIYWALYTFFQSVFKENLDDVRNYFKRELQETFEIINLLKKYRSDATVKTDEFLKFTVTDQNQEEYTYTFKVLDDIRLYREPKEGAVSFYCDNDKRKYAVIAKTFQNKSDLFNPQPVTNNLTLSEFYEETVAGLEGKINKTCNRSADIYNTFRNMAGNNLNELKIY